MRDVAIPEVDIEHCGPCMLAIPAQQRKFVVAWIATEGKSAARAARAAGYSDVAGGDRMRASNLLRDKRVIAAIEEECRRNFNVTSSLALAAMSALVTSKDEKTRLKAIDSVLDRTGYGRASSQNIRVENSPYGDESDGELLAVIRRSMSFEQFEQYCKANRITKEWLAMNNHPPLLTNEGV